MSFKLDTFSVLTTFCMVVTFMSLDVIIWFMNFRPKKQNFSANGFHIFFTLLSNITHFYQK